MPPILDSLPAAVLATIGFAAGGALVTLLVGVLEESPGTAVEIRSVRSSGTVLGRVPVPPGAPGAEPRRTARVPAVSPGMPEGEPITADSIAALIEVLRDRELEVPVEDVDRDDLRDDFDDPRSGGRTHEALDILAPRGTPVIAVDDGTIASLDPSQGGGGIVVYQFDPSGEFVYYYAHLDGFTDGLAEGQAVEEGDILGFVGTSGNAPPATPHLHFAITKTWAPFLRYGGTPINPYEVLR